MNRTTAICLSMLIGACVFAPLRAQPTVGSVSPAANANGAAADADVKADFSTAMAQPGAGDFRLYSRFRGWLGGTVQANGATVTLNPTDDLMPNEELQAILTTNIKDAQGGALAAPYSWQFRAAAANRAANFGSTTDQYNAIIGNDEGVIICADFNGDGLTDIFTGQYSARDQLFLNDGQGGYTAVTIGAMSNNCYAAAAGDFDEDGDMDLAVGGYGSQDVIYFNDGSGAFTTSQNIGTGSEQTMAMQVGDLNGDGHLDLVAVTGGVSASADAIYLGDGQGGFTAKVIEVYPGTNSAMTTNAWDVALADMDGDGDLDIVTAEFSLFQTDSSRVYWNDGNGGFDLQRVTAFTAPMQAICLAVGDIDGDGDNDIVLGTNDNTTAPAGYTYFYRNDGTGNFPNPTNTNSIELTWTVKLADFDGDGDLDLLMGDADSNSRVTFNDGSGNFGQAQSLGSGAQTYAYGIGDLDNDGDMDVLNNKWRFLNGGAPAELGVKLGGNWLNDGDSVQVPYGTTVSSLACMISVTDLDQDYLTLGLSTTNNPNINAAQWQANSASSPLTLYPTSGSFDQAGVTHDFTLSAYDGINTTKFTFHVVVGAAPAPALTVSENGSPIAANDAASGGRDFGPRDVSAGATAATSITVANTGTVDLQVTSIALAGADAGDFVLDLGAFNYTIAPNASSSFGIQFDPATLGAKTASVQITHNAPGAPSPFSFDVAGSGTGQAAIEVSEGGSLLAPGAAIDFGSIIMGNGPATRTVIVRNVGTDTLTLGTPTLAGSGAAAFTLDASGMSYNLAPGANTGFDVSFTPAATGTASASVTFTHNDGGVSSPFMLDLSGTATGGSGVSAGGDGSGGGSGGCVGVPGGVDIRSILLLMLVLAAFAIRKGAARKQA